MGLVSSTAKRIQFVVVYGYDMLGTMRKLGPECAWELYFSIGHLVVIYLLKHSAVAKDGLYFCRKLFPNSTWDKGCVRVTLVATMVTTGRDRALTTLSSLGSFSVLFGIF